MAGLRWLTAGLVLVAASATLASGAIAQNEIQNGSNAGATPDVIWALPFGTGDRATDEVDAISVAPSGATIVSGIFRNEIELGGQVLRSRGEGDIFIASIAPSGDYLWVQHVGSTGEDNTFDLTTDAEGDIYLSGWFSDTVRFGDVELVSRGDADMFVARLAPDGTTRWARAFGGPENDGGNELFVLANGEIAVAALTQGDFVAGGKSYRFGGGRGDSLVVRLDPRGQVRWVTQFDGRGTELMRSVAMNDSGEVFVGFQFRGELRAGARTLKSRGGFDGAIFKLDSSGAPSWGHQVSGKGMDNVRGLAPAPNGSVYAAGRMAGVVDLFGLEIPALGRRGDDYVARMSGSGELTWVVTAAGSGRGRGWEIVADSKGVIVSGLLEDSLTVRRNSEILARLDAPLGRPTSLLAGFSRDGQLRFALSPTPGGVNAGGFGADISVARDGRRAAQVVVFQGSMRLAGQEFRTEAEFDPFVVLLDLNGL